MPEPIVQIVTIKDALHIFHPNSGASDEYCKGLVVGIVAGLMAMGLPWIQAISQVAANLPNPGATRNLDSHTLPVGWETDILSMYRHQHRS